MKVLPLGLWLTVCRCAASSTIGRIRSAPVRPELVVKLSVMRWLAQLDLHLLSSEASVKQGCEQIAQRFVIGHSPETSVRLGSSAARQQQPSAASLMDHEWMVWDDWENRRILRSGMIGLKVWTAAAVRLCTEYFRRRRRICWEPGSLDCPTAALHRVLNYPL